MSEAEVVEPRKVALAVAPNAPEDSTCLELPREFEVGDFREGATYRMRQITERRWTLVADEEYVR